MLLCFGQLFFETRKKWRSEGIILESSQVVHHEIQSSNTCFLQHKRIKYFASNWKFVQRKASTVLCKKLFLIMLKSRQDTCMSKGNLIAQKFTVFYVPFIKNILCALLMRICSAQFFIGFLHLNVGLFFHFGSCALLFCGVGWIIIMHYSCTFYRARSPAGTRSSGSSVLNIANIFGANSNNPHRLPSCVICGTIGKQVHILWYILFGSTVSSHCKFCITLRLLHRIQYLSRRLDACLDLVCLLLLHFCFIKFILRCKGRCICLQEFVVRPHLIE